MKLPHLKVDLNCLWEIIKHVLTFFFFRGWSLHQEISRFCKVLRSRFSTKTNVQPGESSPRSHKGGNHRLFTVIVLFWAWYPCPMHKSIPAALIPPPQATAGHLRALSVAGWGISKFCMAQGLGTYLPRGQPCAFDMHMVSYSNNTKYGGFYWKHKQIGWLTNLSRTQKTCRGF